MCSHPGFRLRAAHRLRDRALAGRRRDGRVGLRAEWRQGLRREDALPAGARVLRRRRGARRQAADPLRRSERRARRARHPSEAAQAEPDRRDARRARAARAHHFARPGRRASHVRARQRQPVHLVGAVAQHEREEHRLADRLRAGVEGARRSRDVSGRAARDRQQRSRPGRRAV